MGELVPGKLAYTLDQAAEAVGICKTSLRELIAEGDLVCLKLKGRVLIRRERLEELLLRMEKEQARAA